MGNEIVGTSVLEGTTRTTIQQGIADAGATATDIIGLVVPVTITVVLLGSAINFGIKKLKGVLSKAS